MRIKVDEEEIIKRLIDRAREDDKPDIIKNRFKTYNSETQPLIPSMKKEKYYLILMDAGNRKSLRRYKKSYRCNLNIDLHDSMTIILNFILKIFLFGVKIG